MERTSVAPLALAVVLLASSGGTEANAQEDWQSAYKLGDPVELKITDGIWQSCAVSENPPGGTMRVMCEEYVEPAPGTYTRAGGRYIVYGQSDLRHRPAIAATAPPAGGPTAAGPAATTPAVANRPAATTPAAATRPAPGTPAAAAPNRKETKPAEGPAPGRVAAGAGGGALRVGEYACYGGGGQILAGLGFKVLAGGRYTDLDGGNSGSYSVNGDTVTFRGGHLDGIVGRDLAGGSFTVGAQGAPCEPW